MNNPTDPNTSQNQGQAAAASSNSSAKQDQKTTSTSGKFKIPYSVEQNHPKLVQLILETESMNDDERQYWFQILPIMTTEQIQRLEQILIHEKEQLAQLDQKYAQELEDINNKHKSEWNEYEMKEKRTKLKQEEGVHEKSEAEMEEEILKKLGDV